MDPEQGPSKAGKAVSFLHTNKPISSYTLALPRAKTNAMQLVAT